MLLFSGCDSETDTEEFEQVGQLERRQASKSTTDVLQSPETATMSTSTLAISTRHVETITEVRSHITHIEHCHAKRPLSYYSIQGPSINKPNPPKKPPRLPTKPTLMSQKSISDTLPSIPEIHSPDMQAKITIYQSSETSSSDDISATIAHHNNCPHTMTSDIYPHQRDTCPTDGEFIHSEFYIDESLPSSLNSDPQDEQKLLKYDSSSDDLRPGDDGSCNGRKYLSDLCSRQLNYHSDDANGVVIHLLQVSHQIELIKKFSFVNFFFYFLLSVNFGWSFFVFPTFFFPLNFGYQTTPIMILKQLAILGYRIDRTEKIFFINF